MQKIYIHTTYYNEKIKNNSQLSNSQISNHKNHDNTYIYEAYLTQNTINFLINLLEEIIIFKNKIPIKKNIKEAIITNVFLPMRTKLQKDIEDYFLSSEIINIEGYINFRMGDHNMIMYSMMYSIVKKSLVLS